MKFHTFEVVNEVFEDRKYLAQFDFCTALEFLKQKHERLEGRSWYMVTDIFFSNYREYTLVDRECDHFLYIRPEIIEIKPIKLMYTRI